MNNFKLLAIKKFKIKIKLITGLHIGADKTNIAIGDIDNPVVKLKFLKLQNEDSEYLLENVPYIPGSSLKGKLRSLVEYKIGNIHEKTGFHAIEESCIDKDRKHLTCDVCKYFGIAYPNSKDAREKIESLVQNNSINTLTRLVFRDLIPTQEWLKIFKDLQEKLDKEFYEIKSENSINRISGTANNPRQTERVPAGVEFEGEIMLKIFEEDLDNNEDDPKKAIEEYTKQVKDKLNSWFELLKKDYLGGNGSRGYGQVEVEINLEE